MSPGDVFRIRRQTWRNDFYEFRIPEDPDYYDDEDPVWLQHVFRKDGSRRIIKKPDGVTCSFMGMCGCTLNLDTRPLVCRLFPFDYNAGGLLPKLCDECPTDLLKPGETVLTALGMNAGVAEMWRKLLYAEILQENHDEGRTGLRPAA